MRRIKSQFYFPLIVAIHLVFWAIDLYLYDGGFRETHSEVSFSGDLIDVSWVNPYRLLGEIFSSWVVTVFAFNFLMATRAKWIESIFGGLDKMYVIHKRSGTIAVVLMVAHVVAVPKAVAFHIGKPLGAAAFFLILIGVLLAALPISKKKVPYNKWVTAHRAMGVFYAIAVVHAFFVRSLIMELPITRVYVFGMATIGVSAWVYRVLFYRLFNRSLFYKVTRVTKLGGGVTELMLGPEEEALSYSPGQFAFFTFPSIAEGEQHPFTISSHPDDEYLRVSVKALGDYTAEMASKVSVGDSVMVEGPFGCFTQQQSKSKRQVWVAGGIGITPFLSLARELGDRTVKLVWCVGEEDDAVYAEELRAIADSSPGLAFEVWASSEQGHINAESLGEGDVLRPEYWICGPQAMKSALFAQLKAKGVQDASIHDEEFAFR